MKKYIFIILTFIIPQLAYSYDYDDAIVGWIGYDHQIGTLNNKLINFGGASAGVSIFGISIGAGVYGNYAHNSIIDTKGVAIIYGGGIIGYRSPKIDFFSLRFNTLLGYGTIEVKPITTKHFVIAPTLYLDFEISDDMALSLGVTYRYFHHGVLDINRADNSFAGTISFSWLND